jgi:hypothetical protein
MGRALRGLAVWLTKLYHRLFPGRKRWRCDECIKKPGVIPIPEAWIISDVERSNKHKILYCKDCYIAIQEDIGEIPYGSTLRNAGIYSIDG